MSNDKTNNYKEVIMSYFSEDGHEFPTPHHKQGHELAKRYFETRLDNTLKQYNDNSHRAFDFYSIKKNLHLFNIYAEELYLLSQENVLEEHYIVRKQLRKIHENLQERINLFGDASGAMIKQYELLEKLIEVDWDLSELDLVNGDDIFEIISEEKVLYAYVYEGTIEIPVGKNIGTIDNPDIFDHEVYILKPKYYAGLTLAEVIDKFMGIYHDF